MNDEASFDPIGDTLRNGVDLTLNHEIKVVAQGTIKEAVANRPTNQAHVRVEGTKSSFERRVSRDPL